MIIKDYQAKALDWLELFFKRCKNTSNPKAAYEETTYDWRGTALHYRPLPTLQHIPYVCLRIPTGGGKTLIGGLAIERANRSLLYTQHSVTLWLVPSDPIREQTLKALSKPTDFLHQAVFSALGDVTVLEVDDALHVKPNVLNGSNVIIVATIQSFKQEEKDRLSVYKQNTDMEPHFEYITDPAIKGKTSLVDVLRMRHPFVIVDEAHNQGTDLAFETLARFEPSAILELTATPDRSHHPSNVLFSVGASALQAEDMIKLPLELVRRENWQDALRDSIACLNKLQSKAEEEQKLTGDYLRPIMLLQAERHDTERETLTPEKVKKALIEDFGTPEEQVAIATGTNDEIKGEDILASVSKVRFIITIDKLREGWDCPFAYVLCTFRNTNSATAAEQVLGRILRMPGAKRKTQQELNEAYAFVTSSNFQSTVESLRDGLVKNGFERQETKDLIHAEEESTTGTFFEQDSVITFTSPEIPELDSVPSNLANKIEMAPETDSITIKEILTPKLVEVFQNLFKTEAGKEAAHQAVARQHSPIKVKVKSPAELGMLFKVPILTIRQGELWEPFEETHLLQGDWRLLDYSPELSETEFNKPERTAQGGRFIVKEEMIKFEYFNNIEAQLAFFDFQSDWDQVQLVAWLERNIPDETILPDEKAAFLNNAIMWLIQQRGLTLEELNYSKFRLRVALETKIVIAKKGAMKKIYQSLLFNEKQFASDGKSEILFQLGKYAYDWMYGGFTILPKHFFPVIGNLKADGEEFECAVFLSTQLEGVKYWVRNVERKPTAFSLQTSTDKFYPDFICQLEDGRILVVEYKNSKDWDLPDNIEKRQLGELWQKRSNGKGLFIMPRGKDWEVIRSKIK
jgi:type III restriction enzyme